VQKNKTTSLKPGDTRTLQADLDRLQEWEAEWLMEFNRSKCEVITLTKKTKPIVNNYTLCNTSLVVVDAAKYLGLNISSKLSWNYHVDCITKRASQTWKAGTLSEGISQPAHSKSVNTATQH